MKTVYIHIGFPKTGTTSIQTCLEAESLKGSEFLYPQVGRVGSAQHFLFPLNTPASGKENTDPPVLYHRLKEEMRSYQGSKIILSTENLAYAEPNYISLLRQSVDGMNVKVILYLREQSGLIASSYMQWVRMLTYPFYPSVNQFLDEHANSFDYRICLGRYGEAFGGKNLIVRHYRRDLLLNGDVVDDFFSLCNIKLSTSVKVKLNPSLSPAALPMALKINQLETSMQAKQDLMDELNALATQSDKHSKNLSIIDAETRRKIREMYRDCNEQIEKLYGINLAG